MEALIDASHLALKQAYLMLAAAKQTGIALDAATLCVNTQLEQLRKLCEYALEATTPLQSPPMPLQSPPMPPIVGANAAAPLHRIVHTCANYTIDQESVANIYGYDSSFTKYHVTYHKPQTADTE